MVAQGRSEQAKQLFNRDPEMVVWWATRLECASALTRLEREGLLPAAGAAAAFARLQEFGRIWDEVQPTDRLRGRAERLLRAHRLRAADGLQLAAMVEFGGEQPLAFEIVCFDDRLSEAALREGFRLAE